MYNKKQISIFEVRSRLSYYARQVQKGHSFIIANRNVPVAELRPVEHKEVKPLKFGVVTGSSEIAEDFDAPLAHFEKDFYGE